MGQNAHPGRQPVFYIFQRFFLFFVFVYCLAFGHRLLLKTGQLFSRSANQQFDPLIKELYGCWCGFTRIVLSGIEKPVAQRLSGDIIKPKELKIVCSEGFGV